MGMRDVFHSMDALLGSPLVRSVAGLPMPAPTTDRVLKSTRLEDRVYDGLRSGDGQMDDLENECAAKLDTFPALARDIYQSVYTLAVQKTPEEELSGTARRLNRSILENLMDDDKYHALKTACEGRATPAYDAACEFISSIAGDLDELLKKGTGEKKTLDLLAQKERQRDGLAEKLKDLLAQRETGGDNPTLDREALACANKLQSAVNQARHLARTVDDQMLANREDVRALVAKAAEAAAGRAEETSLILSCWGGDPADPQSAPVNRDILKRIRGSKLLMDITRELGRLRQIAGAARRDSYQYGLGERYTIEEGNRLSQVLTPQLALLALPETVPLFIRKFQGRSLKQYRRREPIKAGRGAIIYCRDESGSVAGDALAWSKALALMMLGVAAREGRAFALVHYASADSVKTDLFLPGQYGPEEMLAAAELVLGGGTDFEAPLTEALGLMEREEFRRADVIFSSDGECEVSPTFLERFKARQEKLGFTVTGLLMDQGYAFTSAMEQFCGKLYRTSQMGRDDIAGELARM